MLAPIPNTDTIPFFPDGEPRTVTDRINQGPRIFSSKQEYEAKKDLPMPLTKAPPPATLLPQPDMSKPGRFQANEYRAYRPGANAPLGVHHYPVEPVSRENQEEPRG